jgi:hypothetical protein
MEFMTTLILTLANRFDDPDEIRDVSNHGISGGFSGFLYTYEINDFYNEFEDEIEDMLVDELDYTFEMLSEGVTSFQDFRNKCVWIVAESYCHQKVDEMDEATFNEIGYTIAC